MFEDDVLRRQKVVQLIATFCRVAITRAKCRIGFLLHSNNTLLHGDLQSVPEFIEHSLCTFAQIKRLQSLLINTRNVLAERSHLEFNFDVFFCAVDIAKRRQARIADDSFHLGNIRYWSVNIKVS